MKKITFLLVAFVGLVWSANSQSLINITTSGGSFTSEKWVSITTAANGAGTQVWGQGNGTYGNGAGLINQNISLAPGTYYVNCYDKYADGWDGTLISVTSYGNILSNNGGVSPSDGTDDDLTAAFGDTQAQELEASLVIVVPEAPCSTPTVSYTVVNECPTGTGFSISVNISDIGSASGVTITDNQGTTSSTGLTAGTYSFGTYVNATNVVVSVTNDDNAICVNNSATLSFSGACPPLNDYFADAIALNCGDNATGTTASATLDEDNAPDGFGADMDAPNVWFTYTGTGSAETITISLCPSSYDTSFLVYTGTSGSLTLIGGNDDGGSTGCPDATTRSYGQFTSDGTTTYYIAVEGWNVGSVGVFDLTLTCASACTPAQSNQDCASAEAILVNGVPTSVDNTCATVNSVQTSCDTFASIADVWYSFEAPSAAVNVSATLGTALAVHMAAYSGSCGSLTDLSCSSADPTGTLALTGLTAGTIYYLQLWNNGTEEGTFNVTLTDATLSVADVENIKAFTYFPNPVKDALSLKSQSVIQNVSIYNLLGQQVLRTSPNSVAIDINMKELQTGAYFVKVTINDATETIRILKQ